MMRRWLGELGRPAVVAHRGASRAAPENSLAALRLASELGADGVEFDVQRCGTGELVVFHDRSLARCTGHVALVDDTSRQELTRLTLDRVAASIGVRCAGERVPSLAEWLVAAPPGLFLNLEVKAEVLSEAEAATACVRALEEAGRLGSCVVSSFHPAALGVARQASPGVARGALVEDGPGWQWRLAAGLATGASAIHVPHELATPTRVRQWKRLGYVVAVWTVDAPADLRRCLEAGVDVLITNRPDVARPLAETYRR